MNKTRWCLKLRTCIIRATRDQPEVKNQSYKDPPLFMYTLLPPLYSVYMLLQRQYKQRQYKQRQYNTNKYNTNKDNTNKDNTNKCNTIQYNTNQGNT